MRTLFSCPFFYLRFCLVVAFCLVSFGCFGGAGSVTPPAQISPAPIKKDALENPYALRIIDEVNDGQTLHVAAEVKASVPLESLPAVLRLTTLKAGNAVKVNYYPVAHGKKTAQNSASGRDELTLSYDLSTSSYNITDYQLELLWGEEAREHLASRAKDSPILVLRNVTVQPSGCQGTPACDGKLRIMAELYNPGVVPIPSATLGVGFIWQANGDPKPDREDVPQREQKISLNSLNLAPGQSRPLNLTVTSDVPTQPGGQYRPVLRLVAPGSDKPLS